MTVKVNAIKTVVELPRLAQSEEPGGTGGEARGRGLGEELWLRRQSNHITDEHYAAFGRIVNTMAEIDAVLDGIIVAMAKGTMEVLPLLPMVSSKSKGDYILAVGKEGLSLELIQELEKLMDRVRTAHVLRDQIAHCTWTWGTKPGKIKPCVMSARTVLKMRGTEPNEKQWTADELNAEAQRYRELGHDLAGFMKSAGLIPPYVIRQDQS